MYKHSITDLSVLLETFNNTNNYFLIGDDVEITNTKMKSFGDTGTVTFIQHSSDGTGVGLNIKNRKPNHLYVKSKSIKVLNLQVPKFTSGGFINTDGIVCQVLPLNYENLIEYADDFDINSFDKDCTSSLNDFISCRDDVTILLKYNKHSLVSCLVSGKKLNEMLTESNEILSNGDLNDKIDHFNACIKEDEFNHSSFVVTYNDVHRDDQYMFESMQRLWGDINESTSKSMIVQGNKLKSTVIQLLKSGISIDTIEVHQLGNKIDINVNIDVSFV